MAGLYLHIPFCKQACYYCDFHFAVSLKNKDAFLKALHTELIIRADYLENNPINTIYFGGGTPSLLSADEINRLLETIHAHYNIAAELEITLEANPDDLTAKKVGELQKTALNRYSIGVQSFFDDDLAFMNRVHNSQESESAIKRIQDAGIENITIDLIYGIPNLSLEKWDKNLQKTIAIQIPHLSSYALTVEEKTALHHFIKTQKYPQVSDELAYQHFEHLVNVTAENGFTHYELSNFCKEGYHSKHNQAYWTGAWYLGVGPSAHSFNGISRSWNVANNPKYIKSLAQNQLPLTTENLSVTNQFNEYLMTGLRTSFGVSLATVEHRFGIMYVNHLQKSIQKHLQLQNLSLNNQFLLVTAKGRFITDAILTDLFFE